ncbi:MAG: hypothetical protein LAO08_07425 [Acidobacteriia bacterium]|nr:hypothetical protein [Terriglobia bacterium]
MSITVLAIAQSLLFAPAPASVLAAPADPAVPQASASAPQCSTMGTSELTITCSYMAASPADSRSAQRIILNRAVLSFNTSDESQMRVELTFSKDSGSKIADRRTVYLAIDDAKGQNHVRRPLPHVDFTKLEPGKPVTFQDTLLAPAFSSGTYFVSLWIPATDPASKFDPAHNFILSSIGVPDPATGLNQIAKFTAKAPKRRGSAPKQDP